MSEISDFLGPVAAGGGLTWSFVSINTTMVADNGYMLNVNGAAKTMTFPATPTEGDVVGIVDAYSNARAFNITLARNGSNIMGVAADYVIDKDDTGIIWVYADATRGWIKTTNKAVIRPLVFSLIEAAADVAIQADIQGDFRLAVSGTFLQSNTNKYLLAAITDTLGSGGSMTVDVKLNGTTIMAATKITIEDGEKTSADATAQPVLSTSAYTAGDILTFHITAIHSTTAAKGLKIMMAIEEDS